MWVQYRKALRVSAFFIFATLLCSSLAAAEVVRVEKVLDGDSLRLVDGREVRLIGVNAPEFGKNGVPEEPLAREARAALVRLVGNGTIQLEYDAERQDRYGRTLAHAFLNDGRSVEEALLRDGLVFQIALTPNIAHLNAYRAAETEGRRGARGVWAHPYYRPRDAAQLAATKETGFRLVAGRVQHVGRGATTIHLDLGGEFNIIVSHEDWRLFHANPKSYLNHRIVARGWVTVHENRSFLRLSHPIMIELVD